MNHHPTHSGARSLLDTCFFLNLLQRVMAKKMSPTGFVCCARLGSLVRPNVATNRNINQSVRDGTHQQLVSQLANLLVRPTRDVPHTGDGPHSRHRCVSRSTSFFLRVSLEKTARPAQCPLFFSSSQRKLVAPFEISSVRIDSCVPSLACAVTSHHCRT